MGGGGVPTHPTNTKPSAPTTSKRDNISKMSCNGHAACKSARLEAERASGYAPRRETFALHTARKARRKPERKLSRTASVLGGREAPNELDARRDTDLAENARHLIGDRALRDTATRGDLAIRCATDERDEHVLLRRAERARRDTRRC